MSLEDIRKSRHVPAKRGMRVLFDGKPGKVVGASGGYVKVRPQSGGNPWLCHPTWRMTYFLGDGTWVEYKGD